MLAGALLLAALGWAACSPLDDTESRFVPVTLGLADDAPTTAVLDLSVAGAFRRVPTYVCVGARYAERPDGTGLADPWVQIDLLEHPNPPAETQRVGPTLGYYGNESGQAGHVCYFAGVSLALGCTVDPCPVRVAITLVPDPDESPPVDTSPRELEVYLVAVTDTPDPLPGELSIVLRETLP